MLKAQFSKKRRELSISVSLELEQGGSLGLFGASGAGKSTVFNLITGVLPATGGEVHFRGERIDVLSARAIVPRGVARTFQHVHLLPTMSVLENVAIGAHLRGARGVVSAAMAVDNTIPLAIALCMV